MLSTDHVNFYGDASFSAMLEKLKEKSEIALAENVAVNTDVSSHTWVMQHVHTGRGNTRQTDACLLSEVS